VKPPALHVAPAAPAAPVLADVYREHADFVWRLLRHLGVDDPSRDDAFNNFWLVVHRRLADYDGRATLRAWLFGIARNVALHHRRDHARHARRVAAATTGMYIHPVPGPDDHVARREAHALVQRFLAELPEDTRLVFTLVDIEGLTVPEIAAETGANVNINTLYTRLRSARQQFARFVAAARRPPGARHGSD
jgi:RNA polymerase sigma-70 factor (ECF subfamily)